MMFLLIYRKDMELVVSRVPNLITKIRYMMFLLKIYQKDMELVVFRISQSNHEDPIHDVPSNTSEGHGVSGLLCFQSNNLNYSSFFELHLYIRSTNSGRRVGYVPSL